MNTTRQFWALFKFQRQINPFIIYLPLLFSMPLLMAFFTSSAGHDYHPSLELVLSQQSMGLYMIGFLGVMWLAPGIFQNAAVSTMWANGTEFLITRATDRRILLRARVTFFYLLVLIMPVVMLFGTLGQGDLKLDEFHKASYQQVLEQVPGSIAVPPKEKSRATEIIIPHGNLLVGSWRLWVFLSIAICTQTLIYLIYALKYRRPLFWVLYLGIIFFPLLRIMNLRDASERISPSQTLFSVFAAHQALFWIVTILAVFLAQIWCERRFARFEQ